MNRSNTSSPVNGMARRNTGVRSRASSITDRFSRIAEEEPLEPPVRPTISSRSVSVSGTASPARELASFNFPPRPAVNRSATGFEGPTSIAARDPSPARMPRLSRVPTEPTALQGARSNLRVTKRAESNGNGVFADDASDYSDSTSALEPVRSASWSMRGQDGSEVVGKKPPPPPPPPSRSTKPKPPAPPPLKRSALSTSEVPGY